MKNKLAALLSATSESIHISAVKMALNQARFAYNSSHDSVDHEAIARQVSFINGISTVLFLLGADSEHRECEEMIGKLEKIVGPDESRSHT